jgi:hypothetical protein
MNTTPGKVGGYKFQIILSQTFFLNNFNHFPLVSKHPYCKSVMTPIKKNRSGHLIDQISNETVHLDHMWSSGQPNGQGLQQCIEFYTSTGQFNDESCAYKTCFMCKWYAEPVFVLRGLCKNTDVDEKYVLLPDVIYGDNLFFLGLARNNILYSKEMNSWLIVTDLMSDLIKPEGTKEPSAIIGSFQPDKFSNQMPTGMHVWNLTTAECNGMVHLKLTGVGL